MGKSFNEGKMSKEEFVRRTQSIMDARKAKKTMRIIETREVDETPFDGRRYVAVCSETLKG